MEFYELTQALEQTIVLVVQAAHSVTYHRAMEITNVLFKGNRKVSHTIKENGNILNTNDAALFGVNFERHFKDKVKRRSVIYSRQLQVISRNSCFAQSHHLAYGKYKSWCSG